MADAMTAINFVLRLEDSTLSGKVTTDAGGRTRFGIAERFHPQLAGTGFYDKAVDQSLSQAQDIYRNEYWVPIRGDLVTSQEMADRLLSFCVNLGTGEAIRILQRTLNAGGATLQEDGDSGPATIQSLNAATTKDQATFMAAWRAQLATFYRRVVALNPAQGKYLDGWLNRIAV